MLQEGHIHTKVMPRLVLAVSPYPVRGTLAHPVFGPTESQVEGYLVSLQKKSAGTVQQVFDFKADGTIASRVSLSPVWCNWWWPKMAASGFTSDWLWAILLSESGSPLSVHCVKSYFHRI